MSVPPPGVPTQDTFSLNSIFEREADIASLPPGPWWLLLLLRLRISGYAASLSLRFHADLYRVLRWAKWQAYSLAYPLRGYSGNRPVGNQVLLPTVPLNAP